MEHCPVCSNRSEVCVWWQLWGSWNTCSSPAHRVQAAGSRLCAQVSAELRQHLAVALAALAALRGGRLGRRLLRQQSGSSVSAAAALPRSSSVSAKPLTP